MGRTGVQVNPFTIDSWQDVAGLIGIFATFAAAIATLTTIIVSRRKDQREQSAQSNDDVTTMKDVYEGTISALEKHNVLLEEQNRLQRESGERRESAWSEREKEWKAERSELMKRVDRVEANYQTLLQQITLAGVCEIASGCDRRVLPGDRREDISPGGTD